MKSLFLIFGLRLLSFFGATLNTVGFLTFFFWPSLEPYRWHMILAGIALILIASLLERFLIKRMNSEPDA